VRKALRDGVLAAATTESVEALGRVICDALAAPSAVLARMWRVDKERLHLIASAGFPTGGGTYRRTDGEFSVLLRGVGKIGLIARYGEPLVVRDVRGDEEWLANPSWGARQGVRAFAGFPLVAGNDIVGVVALFVRTPLSDADVEDLRFVADFAAIRLRALQAASAPKVIARRDLRALEKESIENALAHTGGRVFGPNGAAALLGMKPTTLASRIKALRLDSKATP
jgi:transcriptional regulator with GAF, ATPase, and Fis domain